MRRGRITGEKTHQSMVLTTDNVFNVFNVESFCRNPKRFQAAGVRQRLRQQRMLCIYLLLFQLVVVYLCIAESAWKVRRLRRMQNTHTVLDPAFKHQHAIVQQTASLDPCYGHLCA